MSEALQHFQSVLASKAKSGPHWRESLLRKNLINMLKVHWCTCITCTRAFEGLAMVEKDLGIQSTFKKEGR